MNPAVLLDGFLLYGVHLAFHLRELSPVLLVASDEKQRRPEDDYTYCRRYRILRSLAVLLSGSSGGCGRDALGLGSQLRTCEGLVV